MPLLFDGHWYASKIAVDKARLLKFSREPEARHRWNGVADSWPHLTPDGKATLVCDFQGQGMVKLAMQGTHGHDLMTADKKRVVFDPAELPDLERLVEFDHLPESRKATSWMKSGDKLAPAGT